MDTVIVASTDTLTERVGKVVIHGWSMDDHPIIMTQVLGHDNKA